MFFTLSSELPRRVLGVDLALNLDLEGRPSPDALIDQLKASLEGGVHEVVECVVDLPIKGVLVLGGPPKHAYLLLATIAVVLPLAGGADAWLDAFDPAVEPHVVPADLPLLLLFPEVIF